MRTVIKLLFRKTTMILLILLFPFILRAQNKNLYVIVDYQYQQLFKFDKKTNKKNEVYFSSIKILEYNKKNKGFSKDKINPNVNDILVVSKQPTETNYYEFQSYKKPKKIKNIDNLKVFTIEDVSKNIELIQQIWTDPNYSIVFIEKVNCDYKLWEMKPIYLE